MLCTDETYSVQLEQLLLHLAPPEKQAVVRKMLISAIHLLLISIKLVIKDQQIVIKDLKSTEENCAIY